MQMSRLTCLLALAATLILPDSSLAQGVLFRLPKEPGAWVRYEGDVKQSDARPERPEGVEELTWIRHLTIKSLGRENATFQGQEQPCHWIEIISTTGQPSEAGIKGIRFKYKVLVPESVVHGSARDAAGVPVGMLPIVKGYKQLDFKPVTPIRAKAMRVYPTISLLAHYKDPVVRAENDNPAVPIGNITAKQVVGSVTMERRTSRSKNDATFWVSDEVPFGLVSWNVKLTREVKDQTDPRTAFKQVSLVEVQMSAHEIGDNAESEIDETQLNPPAAAE